MYIYIYKHQLHKEANKWRVALLEGYYHMSSGTLFSMKGKINFNMVY